MPITSTPSKPQYDLRKLITLVFGAPKIGKSTLAAGFPDAIFIATEPGLNLLPVRRWEYADSSAEKPHYAVETWEDLLLATKEVVESGAKTIVLDTIGNACQLCDAFICKANGEASRNTGKLAFGTGTTLICNELKRYFTRLASQGIGVIMVAHSMQLKVDTRAGEIMKTVPFIPGDSKAMEVYNMFLGMCDLVLYMDLEEGGRVIRTKPDVKFDAGDRTKRLPDTVKLPANAGPDESFVALYTSFYGKPPPAKAEDKKVEPKKDDKKADAPAAAAK